MLKGDFAHVLARNPHLPLMHNQIKTGDENFKI
jgi:hypothetical protein